MPYFLITGFYPDDKKDDSLQFEMSVRILSRMKC
ncbi:pyocin S6 family toxin immunity protein [Pseudomonas sp. Z4-7]